MSAMLKDLGGLPGKLLGYLQGNLSVDLQDKPPARLLSGLPCQVPCKLSGEQIGTPPGNVTSALPGELPDKLMGKLY